MGDLRRISVVALLASLLPAIVCSGPGPVLGQESGTISGTWVANGTSTNMALGEDRSASLVQLSGHVNLRKPLAGVRDYWGKCMGLADSEIGGDVRCVWRSMDGQKIYLVLKTEPLAEGCKVRGSIIGGSGKAKGMSGTIEFIWTSLAFESVENITSVGGYAQEMHGSYRLQ